MKKLFKLFILLNAILISIYASCADYPTIPTTTPMLLTSASEGFSHFPSSQSTQQLTVSILVTPKEGCNSDSKFHLFSVNLGSDSIETYIDCNSLAVVTKASWSALKIETGSLFAFSYLLGPVGIFVSYDMNAGSITVKAMSETRQGRGTISPGAPSNPVFDENTQFYLCADKNGVSQACIVSALVFKYQVYSDIDIGQTAGTDPAVVSSFYPLSDGSLANFIGSAGAAYFGDRISNPSTGTSPTWDPSKNFVTISSGQFLTFPLPDTLSTNPIVTSSFSLAAWVKITALPSPRTTLFAMYSPDGEQVGYKLAVDPSNNEIQLTVGSASIEPDGTIPTITRGQWQLIGFTASLTTNMEWIDGTIFVGKSSAKWGHFGLSFNDISMTSTASVIRIGDTADSFSGQISSARIFTPAGGVIRTTDLCSSDNSVELGAGSFALACSGSNYLNVDECVSSCPTGTRSTSVTAVPLCIPCSYPCEVCNNKECLACEASYRLYQGDCLTSCPNKTYNDGSTCEDCSENCAECGASQCITCETNYLLYQGGCLSSCPKKTYSDESTCEDCSENCAECDASQCITCDDGYHFDTGKECVLKLSTPTPTESGLSAGAIVGISCGCIVLLLFILVLGRRYSMKKNVSKRVSKIKEGSLQTSPGDINVRAISPSNLEAKPLVP